MDQKDVWNNIALPWKIFRVKPDKEVIDFLKDKKGNILDLGCGSGRNFVKKSNLKFYGVDFSRKMLEYAKKHAEDEKIEVELKKSNSSELPFEDNFFDFAIFIRALHCIETPKGRKKSLKELFRVLKPGSECLISVWNKNLQKFKDPKKDWLIPWQHNGREYLRYYYLYEREEFLDLLKKVGFEIIKVVDRDDPSGLFSKKNVIVDVKKPNT